MSRERQVPHPRRDPPKLLRTVSVSCRRGKRMVEGDEATLPVSPCGTVVSLALATLHTSYHIHHDTPPDTPTPRGAILTFSYYLARSQVGSSGATPEGRRRLLTI